MVDLRTSLRAGLRTRVGLNIHSSSDPDSILDQLALIGGAPSYQFRADTVTLSGGNVATIANRRGADALVVSTGTLAAPSADALFAGATSLAFTGTQLATSNLPASAWQFLHDGSGCEWFNVFVCTTTTGSFGVFSTSNAFSAAIGVTALWDGQFSTCKYLVRNATGNDLLPDFYVTDAANAATYQNAFFGGSDPQGSGLFIRSTVKGTRLAAASASAAAPSQTFVLGSDGGASAKARMRWCETLIFPRVLHEYERQIVREYIAARYGIAAPSLTGADRDIMSALPFAYLDPAAYNTNAGKVTAFLDRARPGHTFAQATVGNQVVDPSANGAWNGALTAPFVAASNTQYNSTLPAAAWNFGHDGSGADIWVGYDIGLATAQRQLLATLTAVTGFDMYAARSSGGSSSCNVFNAGVGFFAMAGSIVDNTPTVARFRHGTAASPQRALYQAGALSASGAYGGVPPAGDAQIPLRVGGVTGVGFDGDLAFALLFNRLLSASDEAKVKAAVLSKWGKAA